MTRKRQDHLVQIIPAGKWAQKRAAERITAEDYKSMPHYNGTSSGLYDFSELKRNPGIPASRFAAFELPSRMGNKLHYPDGRVEEMVA